MQTIGTKFGALSPLMDERMRRPWAASEAVAYGWGGFHAVACATGMSPHTIRKGQGELAPRAAHPDVPVTARPRQIAIKTA